MSSGLAGRHFGDDCVHHLAMRVDFERQLLEHFRGCAPALRSRAKDFVRRVDLNSCDYLDEIADAAGRGFGGGERKEFSGELGRRVERDNRRFTKEGRQLVAEINRDSQPEARRSGMWQQDAAVLLSSLALVTASCTQATEMAPVPVSTNASHKVYLQNDVLPKIVQLLPEPAPLRIGPAQRTRPMDLR